MTGHSRYSRRNIIIVVLMIAAPLFGCGSFRYKTSVLPSSRTMVQMSPEALQELVTTVTPIGTSRSEVEAALSDKFRRKWTEDHESVELMAKKGFDVPVIKGDSCFTSDFAEVPSGLMMERIASVYFLFDETNHLKSVAARVWYLGP